MYIMLRKSVLSITVAVFCWAVVETQLTQADDMWDMMNPAWWADQFDDDDDDWDYWPYGPYGPYPYYGGPYGWGYPPHPIPQQPSKKKQPAPVPIPE
jgi:hypothetical protein